MVFTRSVCIVGAGPSGLAAAKAFLQHGSYVVTVYEAADRVGGMWRARPSEYGDKCSPEMKTNLSRFTVGFSDLSWSSVDLSDPVTGATSSTTPMFPRAWQVGRYLAKYTEKFDLESNILFNCKVVNADVLEDMKTWQVTTYNSATNESETKTFDYLVIASGFFDQRGRSFGSSASSNIQHSSAFRNLSSLTEQAGKIAVIGGGISGSEAAAQAAFQISSAKNSPGKSKPIHAESKVYHIINRPFYCLPRYLPQNPHKGSSQNNNNLAPTFLPLDLVLFNLSRRGEGEISALITTVPPEQAQKGHEFMRSVIGGDQEEYGSSALVHDPNQMQYPAYCGITDTYLEFVRSGLIIPVQGWVERVEQKDDNTFHIELQHKEPWSTDAGIKTHLPDVAGIIEATGYKADLDYLHDTPKGFLYPDSSCPRIPFLLTRGSMLSDNPTLGFVGFYEGPYWGVMEVQARYIANSWYESTPDPMNPARAGLNQLDTTERMRHQLRYEGSLQVPQFWMADYVGLIEEIARDAGLKRTDSVFSGQKGPVFPSRYQGSGTDDEANVVVKEVVELLKASDQNGRFVAAAVFNAMQGVWSLHRNIATRNTTPGGVLTGTAQFHPRPPTDPIYAAEYLYIEEGIFKMDNGFSFPATRRYVYRYNETTDKITAWFAGDDGESAGAFFNAWEFYPPADEHHGWMAKGHHWCDPDTYKSGCEFKFRGASLQSFGITYEVTGPKKDYNHESWYKRPKSLEASATLL